MQKPVETGGRYRQLQAVGEGGMGKVFLAEDRDLGKNVALKFLHSGFPPDALASFREEAELLTRLSHPNLVRIYDFFPNGLSGEELPPGPCLAMEYIEGFTLQSLPKTLAGKIWIDLFVQLAQGLLYLHNRQILHRDLKPSNVVVSPRHELKLLDFGLSTLRGRVQESGTLVGTFAYLPPEAFWGEYDTQSDLFALGVLFYEVLAGKLPFEEPLTKPAPAPARLEELRRDLPVYFCDLLHRLLEASPEKRPRSAAGLIRFLNHHVATPYPLLDEESSQAVLQKAPLTGRDAELQKLEEFSAAAWAAPTPRLLYLQGPTGVGRTRLLEEMKWRWQFGGISYWAFSPETAPQWIGLLAGRSADASTEPSDFLSQIRLIHRSLAGKKTVLAFTDLQDWDAEALSRLEVFLSLAPRGRGPAGLLIVLEFSDDAFSPAVASLGKHRETWPESRVLALADLDESHARGLAQAAGVDAPLPAALVERIARDSGGRPLLILEAIRHFLRKGGAPEAADLVPQNLKEISELRIRDLSERARELLALLAVHPEAPSFSEARALWPRGAEEWDQARLELDQRGFLRARAAARTQLALAHPSLRETYLQALPEELRRNSHRRWMEALLKKWNQPAIHDAAILIAEHAAAAGETEPLKAWGNFAVERLTQKGRDAAAAEWCERLLKVSDTPLERSQVNALLAPIHYRLGRFEDALAAYDHWFAEREDDETFLQKVKHRFYTGLVYHTWGKPELARARLAESLEIGDSEKFPGHRPYHVRVYNLLAALDEKEGHFDSARAHLQKAERYAEGMPLLLGNISQRLGKLAQLDLNDAEARRQFELTLEYYRRSENIQAEAIAENSLGMLLLECGELAAARAHQRRAVELAQQSGDLLQWARYQGNSALVRLDLAEFAAALEEVESASQLLHVLGKEEDRLVIKMHRADLALRLGNLDKAVAWIQELLEQRERLETLGLWGAFLLLQGEWAYLTHRFPTARELFRRAGSAAAPGAKHLRILAAWGEARSALRMGQDVPAELLRRLSLPADSLWGSVLAFLSRDAAALSEEDLLALLGKIKASEKPEERMDLYSLLSQAFARRAWKNLASRLELAQRAEFAHILQSLPEEFKMDFEKNRDLSSLDKALGEALPTPQAETAAPAPGKSKEVGTISENRFRQYSEINRQIAQKTDLSEILERVMDAAVELTGAERGFLLLKAAEGQGQLIKGFEVKTARHLNQRSLGEGEFQFSMTAVKQAVDQGAYLLTDNAQLDPRLQQKTSVMQFQLKSILVVPLELEGRILGAVYLDHRYQPQCFSQEDVVLLNAFAAQASLAIQKAQMMEELKKAKERLEVEVVDQARHIEVLTGELAQMRDQLRFEYKEIVGQSPAMMQVFQLLDHVTETTIPVWIWGESGTGKELIARSLHFNSPRKGGPFVSENVSAIPETLLESELFGHKKGAFTHADRDRIGLFEQAHGGTLFLDEVADMSLNMQAKLLRVLQEGEIRPVGSQKKIKVDVRLVTASNRDLNQMVREEKFRQDLFFRVNGLTIKLPPLRERKDDIPLLVNYFIKKIAKEFSLQPSEVGDDAYQAMFRYPWPGNIRELEGVIRNAMLFAKGRMITPEFLSLNLSLTQGPAAPSRGGRNDREEQSEERQLILDALRRHEMSKEKVAEELGISLRSLYTRLEKLGIPKKKTLLAKYLGI
jgi:transcriptional regulator with GAF, ATPase, and Fis domain